MHAPESREDQSRIVIDADAERLIILVYELFAYAGDDFAASLQAEFARIGAPAAAYGTAVVLQTLVNPEGFRDHEGATSVTRRIFASAAAGPRQLSRAAGPGALGGHLALTFPPDAIVVTQSGPDFSVYPMRRLGQRESWELGIYVATTRVFALSEVRAPERFWDAVSGDLDRGLAAEVPGRVDAHVPWRAGSARPVA